MTLRAKRRIKPRRLLRSLLILLLAFTYALTQYGVVFADEALDMEGTAKRKDGAWYFPDICTGAIEAAPGNGSETGIIFPKLDPSSMAKAIERLIEEDFPDSPFKGTGEFMVTTGHKTNVSPFLFVALAAKESSLGTNGDLINKAFNGYGRTASERQPHITGTDGRLYYKWASVAASVNIDDPSHAADPSNSGDMGSYLRAIAAYEPAFKANSLAQLLNEYAPPAENDTGGYISFAQGIINKLAKYTKEIAAGETEPGEEDVTTTPGSTTPSTCVCDPNAGAPVIALDAGHVQSNADGSNLKEETVEGISAKESGNTPEVKDMWDVTMDVKEDLEKAGYKVVLTKRKIDEGISLFERARRANAANADLAISIHYDSGRDWGDMAWVTPQSLTAIDEEKGENSTDKIRARRYTGTKIKYFDKKKGAKALAAASLKAAEAMVETRSTAEGRPAQLHDLIFPKSRALQSSGNISIVQLFADVPWIYNEVGAKGGFGNDRKTKYANGIIEGVKKAVPITAAQAEDTAEGGQGAVNPGCAGNPGGNGDAIAMAMFYAWEKHHDPVYLKFKPSYRGAVDNAIKQGRYVGGGIHPGIDCGGFVSLVMQDSGADPNYNYGGKGPKHGNTTGQMQYLIDHPDLYERVQTTSTKDLRPGAIAFNSLTPAGTSHTYMFIGKQDGFETDRASASWSSTGLSWRTPMAGYDINGVTWFMLK